MKKRGAADETNRHALKHDRAFFLWLKVHPPVAWKNGDPFPANDPFPRWYLEALKRGYGKDWPEQFALLKACWPQKIPADFA